ncbi:hypothetical protein GENT5_17260 [Flavobacterium ammoniigenes]|jgi:RHS repeat-associated protein|uniref:RHS repeat-associated core domain-containing protein n=1 Tax=Flavobacterium ammoniigenes TaxID=1751095 RepID=A0ABM7V7R3_9FLAO|nr:RHS repeat-associated core domain-containing protein [Flavobacterium ammoniigenes]BDB55421.1 hypothetical protein GENT5_17260 [Flavobacterium ammoniigenes]
MGAAGKLYNGNIAETFWSTATDGGFVRNYGYKYDNLNRLKEANYQKSGQLTGMYNENLSYDKNGNIMNLSRYGDRDEQYLPIQIDNLGYNYGTNSNQLKSVTDATNNTSGFKDGNTTGDDYVYDANGNMTVDKNKNITGIVYNHLNLPTKIIFPTGNIVYFYNASGQKVQKVVTENTTVTTTDYLGGYQYKNAVLQFFPTAEGYVKNTPVSGINTYSYVFNYTDHLGNTRLSYAKDTTTGSLKILEESNYYPFGLKHNSYNVDNYQPEYKYQYNGKELQDELGLNQYDYGARNYDPALGRWMNIDPLAEKFISETPYAYVNNDPLGFSDFDGKDYLIDFIRDKDGNITGIKISATVYIKGDGASNIRAGELNKFANDNLKTKTINGISVSIGVNYKYDSTKKEKDLKQGENLLTFDSAAEDNNISHVNSLEISSEGKKTRFLAGKTGTIYDSGTNNNTVFHESMHLLGLSDRYDDNRNKKWIPEDLRFAVPHEGYENNVMGNRNSTNLNVNQYKTWIQHAMSRAKTNVSTNRIIGTMTVDKSLKTKP